MSKTKLWMPERVFFEPVALDYPLGKRLQHLFLGAGIPITTTPSHNRVTGIPGRTPRERYFHAKQTLVVGVKHSLKLDPCRPSADYQFSLGTSCPGNCQYCYLQTTQGKRPYVRIYVNLEEIFQTITKYIAHNSPEITTFEAASTSDPVAVEHLTGSLKETIEFFGRQEQGRLRVVTKFPQIDSLLSAAHQGHTRFRFSINSEYVIQNFEHGTARLAERIAAARRIAEADYPLGFILAPIMRYPGWEAEYSALFAELSRQIRDAEFANISFELIQYRFTSAAKKVIFERFPDTLLDMEEEDRQKKWGKYGKYKYIYAKEDAREVETFITGLIQRFYPRARIEYFT